MFPLQTDVDSHNRSEICPQWGSTATKRWCRRHTTCRTAETQFKHRFVESATQQITHFPREIATPHQTLTNENGARPTLGQALDVTSRMNGAFSNQQCGAL